MIRSDIVFVGFYGQQNTGDDAFVEVASSGASLYWKKENLRFLGISSKLPRTIVPVKGYPMRLPKSYEIQKNILIKNTDYLISAGGSTIHSKLKPDNPKHIALELKKTNKKLKVGAIGVSIGPFKTVDDEKAVQKYLREIDFIALRDQRSYDYVKSIHVPYEPVNAFDLAALLPEIYNYKKLRVVRQKKIIGISVCRNESISKTGLLSNEERRNKVIIELIKELDRDDDILFKFFIINGNPTIGDLELTKRTILEANPKNFEIVNYTRDVQTMWKEVADCDFVVSTRLHAAIFACFANTPFALVEYHTKCTDFLEDVGYDEKYRLFDADFDLQLIRNHILSTINDPSTYQSPKFVENMIEKAQLNFSSINL